MTMIELAHVSRHYKVGDVVVRALDDVSLRIEAGEMLAIMGSSGSGKSTLLNLLGCLDKPSAGRLTVHSHDLATLNADEMAALRRDTFGFIFQRYHLLPHLDAVGNVQMPAIYAGLGAAQRHERAAGLLRRLGLGDRLSHRPNALSGGQQQRVSIARALMNGGQIILADEPTGALDSATGAELLALLGELNALGHTVILVTHDPAVAAHARRIVELSDGRIVRDEAQGVSPAVSAAPRIAAHAARPTAIGRLAQWREAVAVSLAVLVGNRLRAALSMLGIGIGIASVASIMALGDGLQSNMQRNLDAQDAPTIDAQSNGGFQRIVKGLPSQDFTSRDVAALQGLTGVAAVRLQRHTITVLHRGERDAYTTVQAVVPGDLARERQTVVEGRDIGVLDVDTAAQVMVISQKAREALFAPGEPVLGAALMLEELPFTVVGVSKDDSFLSLGNFVSKLVVPETTFIAKINDIPTAPSMRIYTTSGQAAQWLMAPVRQTLRRLHGDLEDFSLTDNGQSQRIGQDALVAAQQVLAAIAGISLLVGGVGVMNIMLVSVTERTREIGIRMAIGARPDDIRRQFLVESVTICSLGALAGLALPGLVVLLVQWMGLAIPLHLSWQNVTLALGTSTAIGLLFGILPADRAARLSPVVALERE
jgi:macrolide transport system ATP-binding/permease protein